MDGSGKSKKLVVNGVTIGRDVFSPTNEDIPGPGQYEIKTPSRTSYGKVGLFSKTDSSPKDSKSSELSAFPNPPTIDSYFSGRHSATLSRSNSRSHGGTYNSSTLNRSTNRATTGRGNYRNSASYKSELESENFAFNQTNSCKNCQKEGVDKLRARVTEMRNKIFNLNKIISNFKENNNYLDFKTPAPHQSSNDADTLNSSSRTISRSRSNYNNDEIVNSSDAFQTPELYSSNQTQDCISSHFDSSKFSSAMNYELKSGVESFSMILNTLKNYPDNGIEEIIFNNAHNLLTFLITTLDESSLSNEYKNLLPSKSNIESNNDTHGFKKDPVDAAQEKEIQFKGNFGNKDELKKSSQHVDNGFNNTELDAHCAIKNIDDAASKHTHKSNETLNESTKHCSQLDLSINETSPQQKQLSSLSSSLELKDMTISELKKNLSTSTESSSQKIKQLESSISQISNQKDLVISDLNSQLSIIKDENSESINLLNTKLQENNDFKDQKISELESQISNTIKTKDGIISDLETQISENSKLKNQEISLLESKIASIIESNDKKASLIESQISEIKAVKDQKINELEEKILEITKLKNSSASELESQFSEKINLKDQNISELEAQLLSVSKTKDQKISNLELQISDINAKSSEKISTLELQIISNIESKDQLITALKSKISDFSDLNISDIDGLDSHIIDVINHKDNQIFNLKSQISSTNETCASTNKKISELEFQLVSANDEKTKLVTELQSQIDSLNKDKDKVISKLELEIADLKSTKDKKVSELDHKLSEINELKDARISELESEILSIGKFKDQKIKNLESQLLSFNEEKESQIANLNSEILTINKLKDQKISEIESLTASKSELIKLNSEIKTQYEDSEKNIANLNETINQLTSSNKIYADEINALKSEINEISISFKSKLEHSNQEISAVSSKLDIDKARYELEISNLTKYISEKESQVTILEKNNSIIASENLLLKNQLASADTQSKMKEITQINMELTQRLGLLEELKELQESRQKNHDNELEELEVALNEAQIDIENQIALNNEISEELQRCNEDLSYIKKQNVLLMEEKESQIDQVQKLREENVQLIKSESLLKSEISSLNEESRELRIANYANLEALSMKNSELEKSVSEYKEKCNELDEKIDRLEAKLKLTNEEMVTKSEMYDFELDRSKSLEQSLDNSQKAYEELISKLNTTVKKWSDAEQRCQESEEAVRLINDKFVSAMGELNNLESELAEKNKMISTLKS
ncbi:hypothetical protein AYI70_g5059 [Smittium culicis]|uniref:Uncharacterized protein n=1 Tax=Smittium culicis TaxID=133412 RepID=A0A1R1XWH1_9FUNG|nr:hypothetical protein AYI70_g5059 [Smittium culicis]